MKQKCLIDLYVEIIVIVRCIIIIVVNVSAYVFSFGDTVNISFLYIGFGHLRYRM